MNSSNLTYLMLSGSVTAEQRDVHFRDKLRSQDLVIHQNLAFIYTLFILLLLIFLKALIFVQYNYVERFYNAY